MNAKILLGMVVLLLGIIGIIGAAVGIVGVDRPGDVRDPPAIARQQSQPGPGEQDQPERRQAGSMVVPVLAGLAIAAGGTLIGIGIGNFRHPKIVPPDSPQAEKAATTTGTTE
jgi:hypothetical protein